MYILYHRMVLVTSRRISIMLIIGSVLKYYSIYGTIEELKKVNKGDSMQEEKHIRSARRRESYYIKLLVVSTAFMFVLMIAAFLFTGGYIRLPLNGMIDGTTDVGAETKPDKMSDSFTETTSAGVPVVNTQREYIPKTDSSTVTMKDASLDAEYAILVDLQTNTVLASFHADQRIFPASMTKIMTLIVAAEKITDLDAKFTITNDIIQRAYIAGASRAGFSEGEEVAMLDLLYGAAVSSGADATDALAIYISGSEAEFVKLMNEKAVALGLTDTNFANVSGLHDQNHYSTVREIAAIMAYAMDNTLVAQLLSAKTYTTASSVHHPNGITLYSTAFSRMSSNIFGDVTVTAAKTGFTDEARFCLATYAIKNDGSAYVLVTAYGSGKYTPELDCKYAYGTFVK